ncbi:MAG: c-type cytochrome biogenesis protein CcmI [Rhodospirillales bacterium]
MWLVIAAMTAAAVVVVLLPVLRPPRAAPPRAAYDEEIYRDQLAEIDRDAARGLLSADQAASARAEVGRRLLAAARAGESPAPAPRGGSRALAAIVALALPAGAGLVYLSLGAPWLGGGERPAERAAAKPDDRDASVLVDTLAQKLQDRPNDIYGWRLLGRSLVSLRRYDDAVKAYEHAVRLSPADAAVLSAYGEAITLAADGVVTPQAKAQFDAATANAAEEPRARFYLGLAELQAGRGRAALDRWIALEAAAPPEAAFLPELRERIAALGRDLALPPEQLSDMRNAAARAAPTSAPSATPPAAAAPRGPSAGDISAAAQLDPAQRMAMVRGMVDQLAARLEQQPADVAGWRRLAHSWRVLGEPAKARDALAAGLKQAPDDVDLMTDYAGAILDAVPAGEKPPPAFAATVDRLAARAPDAPDTLWLAGFAALAKDDRAGAIRAWRLLLGKLDPSSATHAEVARRLRELETAPAR